MNNLIFMGMILIIGLDNLKDDNGNRNKTLQHRN